MILDGRKIRDEGVSALSAEVSSLATTPVLAVVQVGDRTDSNSYIEQKRIWGEKAGIEVRHIKLDEDVLSESAVDEIERLNKDPDVSGIILQLPLQSNFDSDSLIDLIDPIKDVDGLTPLNVKRRVSGASTGSYHMPATAKGIMALLDAYEIAVSGKKAIVIGRSALVGRPTADALLARDATVTIAHSKTPQLKEIIKEHDIVVSCMGRPHEIKAGNLRAGQTVIDVGISVEHTGSNRVLLGDVDFSVAKDIVENITPVPGGVGPMTVLSVLENTLEAYKRQR